MDAINCDEIKSILDSAGVPTNNALGLEYDVIEWPDPETFEENLTVCGINKSPLKFKLPDVSDIEITGVEEIKEEFLSFPPYVDLKGLLKPIDVPEAYLQKDTARSSPCVFRGDSQTAEAVPKAVSPQQPSSTLHLPVKRKREDSDDRETQNEADSIMINDSPAVKSEKESHSSSPMDQDVSMSGSIEILDSTSDDSVIDLTQDN